MAARLDPDSTLSSTCASGDAPNCSNGGPGIGNIEVYNGEIVELATQEDILKSLECPVCRETALAPIYTCENGHIICYTCRQRLVSCALCKIGFSNIRNYGLESIIAKSKLSCKYKELGCSETVLGETLNDHVRSCSFRPPETEQPPASARRTTSSANRATFDLEPIRQLMEWYADVAMWSGSLGNLSSDDGDSYLQTMGWRRGRSGGIPANAVRVSYEGVPTYVCRAFHQRMCAPGMICPDDRVAYVNWFGTRSKYYYEVLVAIPGTVTWVRSRRGEVPENAVIGADQDGSERIYIGRTKIDGQWVSGYVKPSHNRCYVTNGTTAIGRRYYQFLISTET